MTVNQSSPPRPPTSAPVAVQSFGRRVLRETFSKWGARLGFVWVACLAFFSVAAPYVANSRPYFLVNTKTNQIESPLLANLSSTDIALTGIAVGLILMVVFKRLANRRFLLSMFAVVALLTVCLSLVLTPDSLNQWQRWRDGETNGLYTNVVRAPIPYSPVDYNRDARDPQDTLKPVENPQPPSAKHWLGTERDGADLLSQLLHACRIALSIGLISTTISISIGIFVGGLMGYYAGKIDLIGMRFIEIIEATPRLILLLAVAALVGPNLYLLIAVIGFLSWTGDARFVRAEFLRLRNQDFVQAAKALGLPTSRIVFKHMLINGVTPVLVGSSFAVASAILLESVLSYLGLGDANRPSWGMLLNQARGGGGSFHWWIAIFPGLAIFLTVFSYNLIGESMRDALDPKLKKRE
jgi:peptide/nickel transport system permease protein